MGRGKIAGDVGSHAGSPVAPGLEKCPLDVPLCPSNVPFGKKSPLECNKYRA